MSKTNSSSPTELSEGRPSSTTSAGGTTREAILLDRRRRIPWLVMAMSSFVVAAVFGGQYLRGLRAIAESSPEFGIAASTFDGRAWPIEGGLYIHIIGASLALAIGPWQFSQRLRRWRPGLHRWVGRAYLASIALGVAGGVVTSIWSSRGISGFFGYATLTVLWAWTSWRGYRAVRQGDIRSHQAWMIRSFALTFAAVTLRVELLTMIGLQALFVTDFDFAHAFDQAYGPLPYISWIPNLVIAEWLIHRRGLPGLTYASRDHTSRHSSEDANRHSANKPALEDISRHRQRMGPVSEDAVATKT